MFVIFNFLVSSFNFGFWKQSKDSVYFQLLLLTSLLSYFASNISLPGWTLTFSRYVAICKPFLSHTMSKLSRAYKFILVSVCDYLQLASFTHVNWKIKNVKTMFQVIWMISICLAVPQVSLITSGFSINLSSINYPLRLLDPVHSSSRWNLFNLCAETRL